MENMEYIKNIQLNEIRKKLEANNYATYSVENIIELHELLDKLIEPNKSVNLGGSQTLFETDVVAYLNNRNDIELQSRYKDNITNDEIEDIYRKAYSCDYYLASSNAITMNGELINVDGRGNRTSALIYGPKEVILIVGTNKIVVDEQEGINRIKYVAAPCNSKRLKLSTPCTSIGYCVKCNHEQKICRDYVKMGSQLTKNRIKVIFIKGNYGY